LVTRSRRKTKERKGEIKTERNKGIMEGRTKE
jgi:hypothetical protein